MRRVLPRARARASSRSTWRLIASVARDLRLAGVAQPTGIGGERRKRRLESVREVGSAAARALDLTLLRIEQRVDLLDQRCDFVRGGGREVMGAAGANIGNLFAQRRQRPQPESNLDRGGEREHEAEEAECDDEVPGKAGSRARHAGKIGRDHDADRERPAADGQPHHAFDGKDAFLGGARQDVPMQLAR
jgi:hypothetical protein